MEKEKILGLSANIGCEIIANGGEISRAEDTVKRINYAFGEECEIFALPSLLIAQSGEDVIVRRICKNDINLSELERLNALSRKICANTHADIHISLNRRNGFRDTAYNALAIASFCAFFGGSFTDCICAFTIGFLMASISGKLENMQKFSSALVLSFSGALSVIMLNFTGLAININSIITGIIMLLVPGITVTTATGDAMSGNIVAGLYGLLDAITTALAIAFGVAGAIFIGRVIYA